MSKEKLPVLFVSHGSPMHAVLPSEAAEAWAAIAQVLPRPEAVLMVSAHWASDLPLLGAARQPETIHDFSGFPAQLYALDYPAPGAPEVAHQAVALLRDAGFVAGVDGCRGIDHGAWVPMLKMYPQADVPMLQLSVQPELGEGHHLAVGKALRSLRERGVLIIASGHMTHNLRDWIWRAEEAGVEPYAKAFRDWVDVRLQAGNVDELMAWRATAPHAGRAHPSPEHFLPLFVALGAAGPDYRSRVLHSGYDKGVLAMDAYQFS